MTNPLNHYIHIILNVTYTLHLLFLKKYKLNLQFTTIRKSRLNKLTFRTRKIIRILLNKKQTIQIYDNFLIGKLIRTNTPLVTSQNNVFPKSLFHIKCLFDIEEFAAYDLFNFYFSTSPKFKPNNNYTSGWAPTKLNFFYRIRASIDTFRLHTLKFFEKSFKTERRVNLFFKAFTGIKALAYMWFFEFNLAVFLVKLNFSSSIKNAHGLINASLCTVNNHWASTRWMTVKPGDFIRLPISTYLLSWFKDNILRKLSTRYGHARFINRLFFRKRAGGIKKHKLRRSLALVWSKNKPFKFIETDPKTFTAVLLPYKNNFIYYRLTLTLWLNYWNFRVTLWKYKT